MSATPIEQLEEELAANPANEALRARVASALTELVLRPSTCESRWPVLSPTRLIATPR